MAFNLTSWSRTGRDYARGEPPPRGSIEWVAVGDMWDPIPPSKAGFSVYEISYTELDAADRWVKGIDRSVKYTRKIHGDKVLSAEDEKEWVGFMKRWIPFLGDMQMPGHFNAMLKSNKKTFDEFMNASKLLHDKFMAKGMVAIPVPYMGELVQLLREMPSRLTAAQMQAKLLAGVKCGESILNENMPWYYWSVSNDSRGLREAIASAKLAADIYGRSQRNQSVYSPGDPAYDEFLRRLTRIWIEGAGLYGIVETQKTAKAEAVDVARNQADKFKPTPAKIGWLLAVAGVSYLGLHWFVSRKKEQPVIVAVPDVVPESAVLEGEDHGV